MRKQRIAAVAFTDLFRQSLHVAKIRIRHDFKTLHITGEVGIAAYRFIVGFILQHPHIAIDTVFSAKILIDGRFVDVFINAQLASHAVAQLRKRKILFLASIDDCLFCHCPNLVGTNILGSVVGVAERNLCFEVLEIESLEDDFDDFHYADELLLNLVLTAEDVCIVLCERTNAGKSVQFARLLVAVNCTEFSNTQRQILVATRAVLENHTVMRAVHRFEQVHFTFFGSGNRLERVLAVVIPVT